MAMSWAELQATLTLDTRGFEAGASRATSQAGNLQSRLGNVNAVAGRMRGAMSQVTAAMGGVAGQAGATSAAVANMISSFQAGPIVAAAAGITAALTSYFAAWNKQLDEARARLDEYIRVNKSIRGILRELNIVPDDTAQLQAFIERMERADDEAALLRRLEIARADAAEIPPTSEDPGALARLELLQREIKLLGEAAKRVAGLNARRAEEEASGREKQIAAIVAQQDAVRELQRQRELVGQTEEEQAKIRKRHAQEDLRNAGTQIEREKALLELKKAEDEAFRASLPSGDNPMGEAEKAKRTPEVERLVQMGARLTTFNPGTSLQNVANQQLTETRKQTAILNDIKREVGGF